MFSITLIIFLVLDSIWLFGIARNVYQREMEKLIRARKNWIPAGLFYLVYAAGLVYFVILPMAGSGDGLMAFLRGAGFGLVATSTYDLTNLAVLENWSVRLTVIDILWRSFATGLTALLVVLIL
jgi:uncharacterized membrane protein